MLSACLSRLSSKERRSHSGVSLRSSGKPMSTGEGPQGSTWFASVANRETIGWRSGALACMYPKGKQAGWEGVARLGGSERKTWSVSAMSRYSSVMYDGRFASS